MRSIRIAGAVIAAMLVFSTSYAAAPAATPPTRFNCDRACLARHADAYFTALAARDPSRLPLSRDVKYTETGIVKRHGEGLWKTAESPPRYRLNLYDPETGGIGVHAVPAVEGVTAVGQEWQGAEGPGCDGNHVHSIWREFKDDFDRELLREHIRTNH